MARKVREETIFLAISMVAARGTRNELPPNAFARITAWSHGRGTVTTDTCSQWPDIEPLHLPLGLADGVAIDNDKAIELDISLWESVDVPKMLAVVSEAILPSPGQLATCEQEAIER